jgi:two-component system CheB/CheR fusion protein
MHAHHFVSLREITIYVALRPTHPFYVVGIGASAGGLEALEQFFDNMSSNSGMAFVVVQHLSPNYKSMMGQLLGKHTGMVIKKVNQLYF